jgi:hypothetical protein
VKTFVNQAFNRIAVRVFFTKEFHMDDRMVFKEFFDFRCVMVQCLVDEKDDFLEPVPFCIGDQVAEVFAEFGVSSTFVAVPDDVLLRPEHSDEEVASFGIS